MQIDCKHPKHKTYFKTFLKKYPTATRDGGYGSVDLVDPDEWFVNHTYSPNSYHALKNGRRFGRRYNQSDIEFVKKVLIIVLLLWTIRPGNSQNINIMRIFMYT